MSSAWRQPNLAMSQALRGKKRKALSEDPALMMPMAAPRERTNQWAMTAAAGIIMHAMPAATSTPKAR